MLTIFFPGGSLSPAEVERLVDEKIFSLRAAFPAKKFVALEADLNIDGVISCLAAIKMEQNIALVSLREPRLRVNEWLASLQFLQSTSLLDGEAMTLLRTSGTSAEGKTVLLSAAAHRASADAVCSYFTIDASSVFCLSLPLYHVSGLSILFRALASSSGIYLARNNDEIVTALHEKNLTHISLVPTQLKRLLDDHANLSALTSVIVGGDALPASVAYEAMRRKISLFTTYGLTETASMIWVKDITREQGSALSHANICVTPHHEVLVKSTSLFSGYLKNQQLHPCLSDDGFFATGDLSHSADLAHLQIAGRRDLRIISGGENIQPEEIEAIVETSDLIERCVVIGLPHPEWGMRPCAIIKWVNKPYDGSVIEDYLRDRLAHYKIPKTILPWPDQAPVSLKKPRRWLKEWAQQYEVPTNLS